MRILTATITTHYILFDIIGDTLYNLYESARDKLQTAEAFIKSKKLDIADLDVQWRYRKHTILDNFSSAAESTTLSSENTEAEREYSVLIKKLNSACTSRWMLLDQRNSNKEKMGMR